MARRASVTNEQVIDAYTKIGSIHGVARAFKITYPTAFKWVSEAGCQKKPKGYSPPDLEITGSQCRHAREYLRMTRDDFCYFADCSKTALREFESGKRIPRLATQKKIMRVFKDKGITFTINSFYEN